MTIYVIGGINQDIVATSENHLRPGETLTGTGLAYYPGGKGANQAIAAARAGSPVTMIGCTGDDAFGDGLRSYLAESGVDISGVTVNKDVPTGTALIIVAKGENSIMVVLGANQRVMPESVHGIDFEKDDVVVAQFETPLETTLLAFEAAKNVGARTLLNPSPINGSINQELLNATDVLVVNEHEFTSIFKAPLEPLLSGKAKKPEQFLGTLVITLGEKGVSTWHGDESIKLEGRAVDVIDSTGAGDCFMGYLASGLHEKKDLAAAINLANIAASISVTRAGAASSLPTQQEVEQSLRDCK